MRKIENIISIKNIFYTLGVILFILIAITPFFSLCVEAIKDFVSNKIDISSLDLYSTRRLTLFFNTIKLAFCVSISGMILSILISTFVIRIKKKYINIIKYFFLIIAPIPPYIHALAWGGLINKINSILNAPIIIFNGIFASYWVQLMAFLPIGFIIILIGFISIDNRLIDSSRVMKNDIHTLTNIVIPTIKPTILLGGGLMFILSTIDYSVPSLFQYTVYSFEIFVEYSLEANSTSALVLAVPLIITTFLVLFIMKSGLKKIGMLSINHFNSGLTNLPKTYTFFEYIALAIFIIQSLVPIVNIFFQFSIWNNLFYTISSSINQLKTTLIISLFTSILCLVPAYCIAYRLTKTKKFKYFYWIITLFPIAVPSPLVGIGIIFIYNKLGLNIISNSILMPVLGACARFISFAVFIIFVNLKRIDKLLIDSAKILQKNYFQTLMKIKIPLISKSILASFFIIFIFTTAEIGTTLMLLPPGKETLTVKIYNYMHYGASDMVSGLCLIIILMVIILGIVIDFSASKIRSIK